MKKTSITVALLLVAPLSFSTFAEEYQSIFNAHSIFNDDLDSLNSLSYSYFFKKLETRGPLDYFGFNQRVNQITVSTAFPDLDLFKDRNLGVNLSHNYNNWQLSASYSKLESDTAYTDADFYTVSGQYFLSENWDIGIRYQDNDYKSGHQSFHDDSGFTVFTNYLVNLSGDATLGLSLSYEDKSSDANLSAVYFTPLADGRFFSASISTNENFDVLASGKYYFDKSTAVEMSLDEGDVSNIGYSKFLNANYKVAVGVTYPFEDHRLYNLSLTGYF